MSLPAHPPPLPPAREPPPTPSAEETAPPKPAKPKSHWLRKTLGVLLILFVCALVIGRFYLATWVKNYVNHVIDQNPLYDGEIQKVDIHLWKGNYSIYGVRLLKKTGPTIEPFFACDRLDVYVDWPTLMRGKVKAAVNVERPKINFIQGPTDADSQTGATGGGGPWLGILRDLAPFDINTATVSNGEVHFQAPYRQPIVDVYLSQLTVEVRNLTNVADTLNPLNATVDITGKAMDSGDFETHVKFDPFSYRPTFQLALRLLRLDVNKLNAFTKAYGDFDFENGFFDLVVEMNSQEGLLDGYVKPLFRDVQIFGRRDFDDGIFNAFYQALLGGGEFVLRNQPRAQFGTYIPVSGTLSGPKPDIIPTIFNVLRNAFFRAYLPRIDGSTTEMNGLNFKAGVITEPGSPATN